MDKPIALCMIVKNEAAVIERCLRSARPYIDSVVVIDTGSTDGTQVVLRKVCESLNVPLHFKECKWVDFGWNRNQLREFADEVAPKGYHLLLDADMTVWCPPDSLIRQSECNAHLLRYTGEADYSQILLVQANFGYRYVGATHEYITTDQPQVVGRGEGMVVTHHSDGGTRGEKFTRDKAILLAAVKANPQDYRSFFYLARTEECLGELLDARKHYIRRSLMGGFEEEAWYAEFSAARLSEDTVELLAAYNRRPSRAEPLALLAEKERLASRHHLAMMYARTGLSVPYPDEDMLWIERGVYEWKLLFEASICAFYTGDLADGLRWCDELLALPNLDPAVRDRTVSNREFYVI